MRLFVAVDLDDPVRAAIRHLVDDLSAAVESIAGARAARWVRPERLHLTLAFIGDVDADRGAAVERRLEASFPQRAFDATLGGAGTFPETGPVRVVWLGVARGVRELTAIHATVTQRLVDAGIGLDDRPFAAHVTLARFRRPCAGRRGAAVRRLIDETVGGAPAWRVDHVTLYESHLGASGPTYRPLARGALAP